jgi:hypothetical protein
MRVGLICPQCAAKSGGIGSFFLETIRDDGLYVGKCPNNHDLLIATQTLRHELLFEIGLNAVADGYYREAVSSFAAGVERFFEFAIKVMLSKAGVQKTVKDAAWDKIASQSERQLGAYIFLYVVTFSELPVLLSNSMVERRNAVVHKGMLPDKKQALVFGQAAYEVIQSGVRMLRDACLDDVNKILGEHVNQIAKKMGSQYPRTFQVTPTELNIIEDVAAGYRPFQDILFQRGILFL